MTLEECTAILTPMALALGVRMDIPTFKAYHRALENVPTSLLQAACERAQRTPRAPYDPAMPPAPRLRQWAEDARKALIAAHPFEGCADCDGTSWRSRLDQRAVERCPCFGRWQAKLEQLGAGAPLALAAADTE